MFCLQKLSTISKESKKAVSITKVAFGDVECFYYDDWDLIPIHLKVNSSGYGVYEVRVVILLTYLAYFSTVGITLTFTLTMTF